MSFIVDKPTASLPSLSEVVGKSGHAFNLESGAHMIAEATCESPGKHATSHNLDASMSSDEPSEAATKAEVDVIPN